MANNSYKKLTHRIAELAAEYPSTEPVKLLAVSKYASVEAIRAVYAEGQRDFGENYWQMAKEKIDALKDLAITWHFIGELQSNKCKEVAQNFIWVHSLAKIKHVALLAKHATQTLQICLQVNLSEDKKKYGVAPEELKTLAEEVLKYPLLNLRGLMVLPKPGETKDFFELAKLRDQLQQSLQIKLPTLSMGMSDDYEIAIKAGATLVRIGSLIFKD